MIDLLLPKSVSLSLNTNRYLLDYSAAMPIMAYEYSKYVDESAFFKGSHGKLANSVDITDN